MAVRRLGVLLAFGAVVGCGSGDGGLLAGSGGDGSADAGVGADAPGPLPDGSTTRDGSPPDASKDAGHDDGGAPSTGLHVSGNKILDANDQPEPLLGVDRSSS